MAPVTVEFVRSLPKAEVHVHFEGTIGPEDVVELAAASGEALPRPVERLLEFQGLADFLSYLDWACGLVRTPEQLARAAYRFARREAESGAGYADLLVSPIHWPAWNGRIGAFVDAIDRGLAEAEEDGLPPVGLCVSLSRTMSAAEAEGATQELIQLGHPRLVALSVDGNEAVLGRTSPRFAQAFRRAAAGDLHRTVHAGESSGPEGVRDAIEILGAERIDHGVRVIEDPVLVREVADRGVPLDVCPWSNVQLGLYASRKAHPLEDLRRAGVLVSVNTDDPALFGCRLDEEYVETAETYGWDEETVRSVARTSIEASFCDDDTRRRLLEELAGG
jgi:adenosine deaminase